VESKAKPKPEINTTKCRGPVIENCKECADMEKCLENGEGHYYIIVPQWIRNMYFPLISGSSINLFLYLLQIAERRESSKNFGKCWPTNEQIADKTGVSRTHIDKQMKQLEKYSLIKRETIRSTYTPESKWKTTRIITLLHMVKMKEYRVYMGKKRLSLVR